MKKLLSILFLFGFIFLISCGKEEESLAPLLTSGEEYSSSADGLSSSKSGSSTSNSTSGGTTGQSVDQPGVITAGEWNDHLEPSIGEYEVEFLNDLMVRLIGENLE